MKSKFLFFCFFTASISTSYAQNYFKLTYNVSGGSEAIIAKVPIVEGTYDIDHNNDGDFDDDRDLKNQTGITQVNFRSPGINTIAVRPSTSNASRQLRINFGDMKALSAREKLVSIDKWGDIVWTSMRTAFFSCRNMTLADDAGVPDLSMVTDMHAMFASATNFNGDLSNWNLSQVTDTSVMFAEATSFNGNLSGWNVSSVTSMREMFRNNTQNPSSFTSDLSNWDVSQVTPMNGMFNNAINFTSDLSGWNVSKVTTMESMFRNANSFTNEHYSALLIGWSNLPSLKSNVPFGAPPLTYCRDEEAARNTLTSTSNSWNITGDKPCYFTTTWNTETGNPGDTTFVLPITEGTYDVDVNNDGDFQDANDLTNQSGAITIDFGTGNAGIKTIAVRPSASNTSGQLRINHFDRSTFRKRGTPEKLTSVDKWGLVVWGSMVQAFRECVNMNIPSDAGVPNLTMTGSIAAMFFNADGFTGDLSNWDVSNITSMWNTFNEGGANFTSDLSKWDVSNVTEMRSMFDGCSNFNSNLSDWNVSQVARMGDMFKRCTNFNGDLSNWDTSKVEGMSNMFEDCTNFNGDLSNWDTSKVFNMKNMFEGCINFNSDLSNWNVSRVSETKDMFLGAASFNADLSRWNVSEVIDMSDMFSGATSFNSDLNSWNVSQADFMGNMFKGASSFNSDLSNWNVHQITDMENMLAGATSFSADNYDKLLTGWSKIPNLSTGVPFGAPPTSYCNGKAGRDILINTYRWSFRGDGNFSCEIVTLSIDAFLQGPYDAETNMMNDGLRAASSIPTTSPYADGTILDNGDVFDTTTGDNAIVDWVEVSLHDPNDVSIVITTAPALIQRDGDVVALEGGSSNLQMNVNAVGDYYVSINHRNHIAVVTANVQSLSNATTAIDFTNDLTIVTGGSNAMAEVATGIYALFSGDVNGNNQVQVDDYNAAIQDVGRGGYLDSDVDMNGELQVSDINFVLKTLGKGAQF